MNKTLLSVLSESNLVSIASALAVFGSVLMLSGGVWDAASHALKEPEYFWSIQHVAVYSGVGMVASSAIVGGISLKQKRIHGRPSLGLKIIIIGAILQISAGYADSISHDTFGIDGLLSLSHQPLEAGLVLSAFGSYLAMRSLGGFIQRLLPFSIITLILSISWLAFNLALLIGGIILCIPVYHLFSSGCAIL